MQVTKPILGIFAVLGTWPNWENYFDLSRKGQKLSFALLALSLAPLWLVVYGIQSTRASERGRIELTRGLTLLSHCRTLVIFLPRSGLSHRYDI